MKYVEAIKSFLLLFLVGLSLTLTVMIWNYKPNHEFIDDSTTEEISIGERIHMKDIFTSYRSLYRINDEFKASVSTSYMENAINYLEKNHATDLTLVNNDMSAAEMNELMRINNRMMLFFGSEIPLRSFIDILQFENDDLPEMSFNRIIIDWNELSKDRKVTLLLLNTNNGTLYRTAIPNQSVNQFKKNFIEPSNNFISYVEHEIPGQLSIYVSTVPNEAVKYMYYMDESSIDEFKSVLFQESTIVQKSVENSSTEKYMGSMSLMTVDTSNRILNYVYPSSEGIADILPSHLLLESFDFVNDHGGFNADYRIANINREKHLIEYQMYYQGYPVFSSQTITKISTTWGDNQLHKYRRPYYVLEMDIPDEMNIKELPSGRQVMEQYVANEEAIKDLVLGYYLVQNTELSVFELEPSWFIMKDSGGERVKMDHQGGMNDGLE